MPTLERKCRIARVAGQRQAGVVVLEDVYDPHNAAAVLRSCEAFGVQKVFFVFDKQKKFNPKKIGSTASSSANKWLDFEVFTSMQACLKRLKHGGYTTYATVLDSQSASLFKTKFTQKKVALLFGNEHSGLSASAIKLADCKLYIPMRGFVQSLNLSVTAAICLFELTRQRQKRAKAFLLPAAAKNSLQKKWLK